MSTLAQERSAFALERVQNLRSSDRTAFAKLVAGLPAMILQNGFGLTLAFLLSKGTDKTGRFVSEKDKDYRHLEAFDIMMAWLQRRRYLTPADRGATVVAISRLAQQDYLLAQEEALALLEWVKRYAGAGLFSQREAGG